MIGGGHCPLFAFGADIFGHRSFVYDRLIEPPSACEIVTLKAVAGKNAASDIRAQTAVTMHVHGLACRDLVDALAQRVKRNVHKSVDLSACDLGIGSCVKQRNASVAWELFHVVPEELPDLARDDVFGTNPTIFTGSLAEPKGGA